MSRLNEGKYMNRKTKFTCLWVALSTFATIAIAIFTWQTVCINKNIKNIEEKSLEINQLVTSITYKPQIGIKEIKPFLFDKDKEWQLTMEIKNYGSVIAKEFNFEINLDMDGVNIKDFKDKRKPSIIFPQAADDYLVCFGKIAYQNICIDTTFNTELNILMTYKGINEQEYFTEQRFEYINLTEEFKFLRGDWGEKRSNYKNTTD